MDGESYLRFVLALVLVLGLLAAAAFLLRRSGIAPKLGRGRRLSTVESLPLGPRHRLILVRRDDVEHLLLMGPQGDTVVEAGIPSSIARQSGGTHLQASQSDRPEAQEDNREPSLTRFRPASGRPPASPFERMLDGQEDSGTDAPTSPRMTSTNEQH